MTIDPTELTALVAQGLPAELAALVAREVPTVADAVQEISLERLVTEMIDLKTSVEELSALLKATQAKYDEIRKKRLPDLMQQMGMIRPDGKGGFSHSSGAKIHLRAEVYAYCKAENQPAMLEWLREHGHGDLIKEVVHPLTLKAFAKEQLQDGSPLPPQLTVTPETVAVLTQPKSPTGETQ